MALAQTDASPIETPNIIDECCIRFSVVPQRGNITGFEGGVQFTARHLALFLSNQWLDEVINAGSDWILRQLGASRRIEINSYLHVQQIHVHLTEATYLPWNHLISAQGVDNIFLSKSLDTPTNRPLYPYADCFHGTNSPLLSTLDLLQW